MKWKLTQQKREYFRRWREKHPGYFKKYKYIRDWTVYYNEKKKEYNKEYNRKRRKSDIKFRFENGIKSAISFALKRNNNGRKWQILVGYTLQDLMIHLEKQFDNKMTWDNYGIYWEIDHKIPKSWFKYLKAEDQEFKKCWALDNLQPLEKSLNRKKHNYYQGVQPK